MKNIRYSLTIIFILLLISIAPTSAQQPANRDSQGAESPASGNVDVTKLPAILLTLAQQADKFEGSLPDFVVQETLTQEVRKPNKEKPLERTVTVSRLTGRQLEENRGGHKVLEFKELRQVQSVNGKPTKSAKFKTNGPQVGGTFSSIFLSHFATKDQQDYVFDIERNTTTINNHPAYLLIFFSRFNPNNQYYTVNGERFQSQQRGRAWIDVDTLTPLRIEYMEQNLPKDLRDISYTVDYAPVSLNEGMFFLPRVSHTEFTEKNEINVVHVEYQEYKKFSTDVKVE